MHWIIISIVVLVIVIIQFSVFGKTCRKLGTYRKSFNNDDKWIVNRKGDAAQIIPSSLNEIYTQIEEKKTEIAKIEKALDKSNKKLSKYKDSDIVDDGIIFPDPELSEKIKKEKDKINRLSEDRQKADEDLSQLSTQLESQNNSQNEIQKKYVDSINLYLEKNCNRVTDFHLIKNIVDRNCDAVESDIHTQVPVPLYLGLVGTMLGIIVGVLYLVVTGSLHNLLTPFSESIGMSEYRYNEIASEGVEALLGGVGVAMISSIVGILLTTIGSWKVKNCILYVDGEKNAFLSWMQSELLPALTNDAASALEKLSENLSSFNQEFAVHTSELSSTLGTVQDTSDNQVRLLNEINNLNISKIAKANVEVYDKLKNCTDEIGKIGDYVGGVNLYLDAIITLTEKLDDADKRTRMVEEMAGFFKEERVNLDNMKGIVAHNIHATETYFSESSKKLREAVEEEFKMLQKQSSESMQRYVKVMDDQQINLEKKASQFSEVVEELKNLGDVKSLMSKVEKATREQNEKLSKLSNSIDNLASMKTGSDLRNNGNNWYKYAMLIVGGVASIALILIVALLYKYFIL